ncbi:MAG: hypothetical protein ACLPYZ_07895 [Limisphaerales bacterium]
MSTPSIAKSIEGDKPYQKQARRAFPLLVRQAFAHQPIFYESLATELGMPNPRNLNYVLGSIGTSINELSGKWKEKIPMIQCLVINQQNEIPGDGVFEYLLPNQEVETLSRRQKRELVNAALQKVYLYPRWLNVLDHFSLPHPTSDFARLVRAASAGHGGGESEAHRDFKEWVATQPQVLGLSERIANGVCEYPLPSGDVIDVYFTHTSECIAVETKSYISDLNDITRGIFQCVKYQAVLEASLFARGQKLDARAILALEAPLPSELVSLKNLLGVIVYDNLRPKDVSQV